MSRAKVTHSNDGVQVTFRGDKRSPEPSTAVICFPGGHVEVSRTSEGKYWAHCRVDNASRIVGSRIDHDYEGYLKLNTIEDLPQAEHVNGVSLLVDGPFMDNSTL